MKSVHPWAVMHDSWHSQSDADIIEFDTVPLHLPTPKHSSQRGGGAVVGAVGQTAGPLVQVEQVFRPVQVECTLHIPLRESKVKSEHPWLPAQVAWHSQSVAARVEVRTVPLHLPLSKQASHSETIDFELHLYLPHPSKEAKTYVKTIGSSCFVVVTLAPRSRVLPR